MKRFATKAALLAIGLYLGLSLRLGQAQETIVKIGIPDTLVQVDPMIYGQMLENVNDSMIYGGVADLSGNVRWHLIPHLRELNIPIMRWPGGTVVYEYHWRNGIGPRNERPTVSNLAWGGIENYQFGTDEFLQWCKKVGTTPYINLNMSLHPDYEGTLGEALDWMAYVNGDRHTGYGKLRAENGHAEPYNVLYWCIGNENYLPSRSARVQESDEQYARRLNVWASTIRHYHPDVKLLGIGHTKKWNQTVLEESGHLIDFLTQHYYVNARVKGGEIQSPLSTLFAPAKMEAHLAQLGAQLAVMNGKLGRTDHPIRLSVDEWNNRHSVESGAGYKFSRQAPRRQFDVAVVGGMLNAFIRQSPHVGMANYIFPVNAHGLIRTVGNDDAYQTPIYHVFKQYREQMVGVKLAATVEGPSIDTGELNLTIDGDTNYDSIVLAKARLPYIDAAAVRHADGNIYVSLVNRSPDSAHRVSIAIPAGYGSDSIWMLSHEDINARNSADNLTEIVPSVKTIGSSRGKADTEISPCGLHIIKLVPVR